MEVRLNANTQVGGVNLMSKEYKAEHKKDVQLV